jgi:hypothetical protein
MPPLLAFGGISACGSYFTGILRPHAVKSTRFKIGSAEMIGRRPTQVLLHVIAAAAEIVDV